MSFFKDRAALGVMALLAVGTIGGAFALMNAAFAEPESAGGNLSKKQIERIVHEYIVNHPEVLVEAMEKLQSREEDDKRKKAQENISKLGDKLFNNAADHVTGNPSGDVTIVEFFDYRCGYCKKARPEVLALLKADPKIRLVVKEFPILGKTSETASRAALAAKKQGKYWDFHLALIKEADLNETRIFELAAANGIDVTRMKTDMQATDVTKVIDTNHELAQKIGVDSTPSFIFGKELVAGALSLEQMQDQVAKARKSAQ